MEAYNAILQHCNGVYNEACDIIEGNNIFDEHGEIIQIKTREEQLKEALFRLELCNTLLDEEIICSEFYSRLDESFLRSQPSPTKPERRLDILVFNLLLTLIKETRSMQDSF